MFFDAKIIKTKSVWKNLKRIIFHGDSEKEFNRK